MRALASLLALATLAGCAAPGAGETTGPEAGAGSPFEAVAHRFDGEFLAGGVDAPATFPFEVPMGAGEVAALLTWTIPGAILEFQLLGPDGAVVAEGWAENEMRRYVTTTGPPPAGAWSAVVMAERGVDVHFVLDITARLAAPFGPLTQTYSVAGGGAFAEVNLNMVPGDSFQYDWSADGELYFNVHYHAPAGTQRPIEYVGTAHQGNFTAPANEVYSLLLRNDGLLPVSVELRVDGAYRLHSMTR